MLSYDYGHVVLVGFPLNLKQVCILLVTSTFLYMEEIVTIKHILLILTYFHRGGSFMIDLL